MPATIKSLDTYAGDVGDAVGEEVAKGLRRCLLIQKKERDKDEGDGEESVAVDIDMVDEGEPFQDLIESSDDGVALPRSTAGHGGTAIEHGAGRAAPLPAMASRAIAGQKFDLPAWLDSLKRAMTGKRAMR
ncbi:hypothetical protein CupriaWKF_28000 [Cupriavidus sp. WKF15]|uniref:hypothetical protein n=1 Tax=Cupriavidus sp. WKF15 TaxID=3032282 RepID=UPI0023E28F09|nr:hypothetical protein [Cupriavidus sp. WKF15]WER48617.1 hypothetical protein CupriaWKF_28000 [Cupriavidus sp. WKF15]